MFVLRFWKEVGLHDLTDPTPWRGRINHVNSQRRLHVEGIERAFEVIRSIMQQQMGVHGRKRPDRKHT